MLHDEETVVRDPALLCTHADVALEALYRKSAAIGAYISLCDTSRAFSSSRVYEEYPVDQTFEFVTSTPLYGTMDAIQEQMRRLMARSKDKTTRQCDEVRSCC